MSRIIRLPLVLQFGVILLGVGLFVTPSAEAQFRFNQGADGYSGPRRGPSGGGKNLGTFDIGKYRSNTLGGNNYTPRVPNFTFPDNSRNRRDDRYYDNRNYDNRNYYDDRGYSNSRSVPTQRSATVRTNAKPPEKIHSAKPNSKPQFAMLDPIDAESHKLLHDLVETQAHKSVDELENKLGDAAKDPAVAAKLEELRKKIDNGMSVTEQDIDQLGQLVNMVDGSKFPAGFNPDDLSKPLDDIINMSEANELMHEQDFPEGGLVAGLPTGQIMTMPALPDGEMLLLPDGSVAVGTGGEGAIGISDQETRDLLGINLGIGEPEPDSDANVAKRVKSGTFLMNPERNAVAINYVVSESNYSMKAGFTQALPAGQTWVIRFDRGGKQGQAKYTLSDGTYAFGPSPSGDWELYKQTFKVTIDNADNEGTFYLNIDNTQEEVAAGAKRTFTSLYPILVRFDRGNGGDPVQKRIDEKNADLVVAVNANDGLWDLYPEKNFEGVARKSKSKNDKIRQALLREKLRLLTEQKDK